ncbi:hypothetical protein Tco_0937041 [Tanacetum coccineum]|uniref:Uncharacterized protein n=1 Tax=Tanacetum coccineum TaxID=301880 RepID=A0ABQ5DD77_9ASTR
MASLDYRLNPIYTIKECSSCGTLYTKSRCCSKGGFVDKFVRDPNKTPDSSQRPPQNCSKCGNPVDGLYCRQCALLRKKLKEVWSTICYEDEIFQEFLNTSESSNNKTNVVNAPQEPFVFNQDPGENSSQRPPHIDHHCCYGCGDSLDAYVRTSQWFNFIYYDDDDDEESSIPFSDVISELHPCVAITPVLSTEEPDNSLNMGDEHLDTILATESDEVIKSSVEDLVPIPSESEGISDKMCDVPFRDNSPPLNISKDQFEDFSDSNDDSTSIDDDYFFIDDIDYVDASPPESELVSLEEVKDFHPEDGDLEDDVLREKLSKINLLIAKIEALKDNPTPSSDFCDQVLISPLMMEFETIPDLETFKFDIEEKNSGSTTIHADISLPDLECFYFKSEPDPGDLTSIINPGIRENFSFTTNVNLPFKDDQSPLFAYAVWIFLPFLTYPVAPPYLLSSGNEDTIFDPDISIYHSFMPGVSHRSGTFMKFNVYLNNLNESLMEILSSTCFPMDQ